MRKYMDEKLTTLSIHSDTIKEIERYSEELGLSTNEIILYCLSRFTAKYKDEIVLDALTSYQPRCKSYKAYHIKMSQVFYEVCFDLRKISKLSLSFIFSIAFTLYVHELFTENKKSKKIKNSYQEFSYSGEEISLENGRCFIFCWKEPPKR